jgi:type IV secretory pathway TraG/TraD family ATPase VirD4
MRPKHHDKKPYIVTALILYVLVIFYVFHCVHVYDTLAGTLGPAGISMTAPATNAGSKIYDNSDQSLQLVGGDNSSPNKLDVAIKAFIECFISPFNLSGLVLSRTVKPLLIITGALLLIAFLAYTHHQLFKQDAAGIEAGSASWYTDMKTYNRDYTTPYTEKDIKEGLPDDNMILAQGLKLSMNTYKTNRNLNVLVIGGSGAGKTRFFIKPNLLQMNCSYVITDPSGETMQAMGKMFLENGYKVKLFSTSDLKHSNTYNPMDYIYNEDGTVSETKVDILVATFLKNADNTKKTGGDPFWTKAATAFMRFGVLMLAEECPCEQRNLYNLLKLTQSGKMDEESSSSQSALDNIVATVRKRDPEAKCLISYDTFKLAPSKTANSILISLAVDLERFANEDVRNMTSTSYLCKRDKTGLITEYIRDKNKNIIRSSDNLDLHTLGDEKTVLFVNIPQADSTFNFLVSMMYSQLFNALYTRAEKIAPNRYHIYDRRGDVISSEYETQEAAERARELYMNAQVVEEKQKDGSSKFYIYNPDATKEETLPEKSIERNGKGYIKQVFSRKVGEILIARYRGSEEEADKRYDNNKKNAKKKNDEHTTSYVKRGKLQLPVHVSFMLDEFANIGDIPDFEKMLSTMRKYAISCVIILQSLAQIKGKYEKEWEVMVGNCDTIVFLGSSENDTDKYISEKLGKATIRTMDEGQSKSSTSGSVSNNFKHQARDLMDMAEVSHINNNDCIVCIRGLQPFFMKKFKYPEHPNYKQTGDADSSRNIDMKYLDENFRCLCKIDRAARSTVEHEQDNMNIQTREKDPAGNNIREGGSKLINNNRALSKAIGCQPDKTASEMRHMTSVDSNDYSTTSDVSVTKYKNDKKNRNKNRYKAGPDASQYIASHVKASKTDIPDDEFNDSEFHNKPDDKFTEDPVSSPADNDKPNDSGSQDSLANVPHENPVPTAAPDSNASASDTSDPESEENDWLMQ